jgi:hypothetical protein
MSYNLFLDDERIPRNVTWVQLPSNMTINHKIARNYKEFVDLIYNYGLPATVSFDHDLADEHYKHMLTDNTLNQHTAFVDDEFGGLNVTFDYGAEKTGFDCAKWLVDFCIERGLKFPPYTVHSMNPVGAERIRQYIEWARGKMNI